jgi:hypothetical protein
MNANRRIQVIEFDRRRDAESILDSNKSGGSAAAGLYENLWHAPTLPTFFSRPYGVMSYGPSAPTGRKFSRRNKT